MKTKYFPNSQAIPSKSEVNRLKLSWLLPSFSKRNVGILLVCEAEYRDPTLLSAMLYGHTLSTSHLASQNFCSSSIVAYIDLFISYVFAFFLNQIQLPHIILIYK